jgi:hypothetical protein
MSYKQYLALRCGGRTKRLLLGHDAHQATKDLVVCVSCFNDYINLGGRKEKKITR